MIDIKIILQINKAVELALNGFLQGWDGEPEMMMEGQVVPIDAAMAHIVDTIADTVIDDLELAEPPFNEKDLDDIKRQYYEIVMSKISEAGSAFNQN
tara:strand:- start:6437 stop:6727 length:291 start_codon:yes stop_codon:yes gene_type:complete